MAISALLVALYYFVPVTDLSGTGALVKLALSLVVLMLVTGWEFRRVTSARHPVLRVVEALAIVLPLFLIIFSSVDLSLSGGDPSAFSERLTHTSALYFVIVVFGTVGFGDIAPRSDAARIVTSFQIIFTLLVLGTIVKLLVTVAQRGFTTAANTNPPTNPESEHD